MRPPSTPRRRIPGRPGTQAEPPPARGGRALRTGAPAAALALALALTASACVPGTGGTSAAGPGAGATARPDPAKAGRITLTVWDEQVTGGSHEELTELNREFEKKYPNVRIRRVSRSFNDLKTTLKLALSGNNPPDVVQANQGYADMVAFVKAGLLRPLDDYAGIYGWNSRFPQVLLDPNRVSVDGTHFGTGRLYGLSQTSEYIGLYYNKKILKKLGVGVPKTWHEWTDDLARAKKHGVLPIQFGNLNKTMAIHLFGVVQDHFGAGQARDTVYGRPGGGFERAPARKAAATVHDWAKKGYLPASANGQDQDAAYRKFAQGQGAFLVSGTWAMSSLKGPMGGDVGVVPPPPDRPGGRPVSTGGPSVAFSVTTRSKHPDVAAAYLDWISNAHASDVITRKGELPAVPGPAAARLDPDGPDGQLVRNWKTLSADEGLVPYLDYSTPTFFDTLTSGLQNLISGKSSPSAFTAALQKDYAAFRAKQRQPSAEPGGGR